MSSIGGGPCGAGGSTFAGAYMRLLMDEHRNNLEEKLKEAGYAEITTSHGWIFHHTQEELLQTGIKIQW